MTLPVEITPLDPADFRLTGFPDPGAIAARRIAACGIRQTPLGTETFRDVTFVPGRMINRVIHGGVRQGADWPLPFQLRRNGRVRMSFPIDEDRPATASIDEPVLWLGWMFDHFGHFLLEGLARLWAAEGWTGRVMAHIAHPEGKTDMHPNNWRLLELLGLPRSRFIEPAGPVRLREVICPEPAFELQWAASAAFAAPLQRLGARFAPKVVSEQPLYLSRSRLPAPHRRIAGEAALEARLAARGYRVLHPQEMAIEEQIAAVNGHARIVATNGSAAHMVVFARQRPQLTILTQERLSQDFFLCSHLAGAPTEMVCCLVPEEDGGEFALRVEGVGGEGEWLQLATTLLPSQLNLTPAKANAASSICSKTIAKSSSPSSKLS
jgi:hypothetical protein